MISTKEQFLKSIRSRLDAAIDNNMQDALRQTLEGGEYHFTLGMWLRNNWGLWKGENELTDYFNSIGIYHADDMSGIILHCYVKMIRGDEIKFEDQINKYINYWKDRGIDAEKEFGPKKSLWQTLLHKSRGENDKRS